MGVIKKHQIMTKQFLSGLKIDQLYKAREQAGELTGLIENLPAWIFDEGDAPKMLNCLDRIRAILNTAEEVK
tara:strand:- start:837 stop:1052 length:216 start_codon:yes stop_codon:yes gene_type:complete